jgi:hypothetical protein
MLQHGDKVTGRQCLEFVMERPAYCVSAKYERLRSLLDRRSDRRPSVKLSDATQVD